MAKRGDPHLKFALLEIAENQINAGDPPETRATLDRLMAAGHSREQAMELIACVVTSEIFDILKQGKAFNEARYVAALQKLPTLPWDK